MEQTFVMIKPDGVSRKLIGKIVERFEDKGLALIEANLCRMSETHAEQHYEALKDKPFFPDMIAFITSGSVFAMIWEGENAVRIARTLIGSTNPVEAAPGTIRGDYAKTIESNIIHASDSIENAAREIALFFPAGKIAV
ncbi:nucleoside-diphosphate kinase [Paenibacillus sp. HB172176]|uniref:nucleoside-diphosphate kinase n=1 Tax=Paenibacillus sp. HB172176 TaxID=2493690 RepID=UPI00143A2405|nr:nucleoside-diphosphate kinase [Paenibacillus sp. HB172176]